MSEQQPSWAGIAERVRFDPEGSLVLAEVEVVMGCGCQQSNPRNRAPCS